MTGQTRNKRSSTLLNPNNHTDTLSKIMHRKTKVLLEVTSENCNTLEVEIEVEKREIEEDFGPRASVSFFLSLPL